MDTIRGVKIDMKKTSLFLLVGVACIFLFAGCSSSARTETRSTPTPSPAQAPNASTTREPSPGEIISEKAMELYEGIVEIEDANCKISDSSVALTLYTSSLQDTYDRFVNGDDSAIEDWSQIKSSIIDASIDIDNIHPDIQASRSTAIQFCDSDGEPIYLTISKGQALYDIVVSAQKAAEEEAKAQQEREKVHIYILNTSSKVFHLSTCKSVDKIKDKNRQYSSDTRDALISSGYTPCGNCHP